MQETCRSNPEQRPVLGLLGVWPPHTARPDVPDRAHRRAAGLGAQQTWTTVGVRPEAPCWRWWTAGASARSRPALRAACGRPAVRERHDVTGGPASSTGRPARLAARAAVDQLLALVEGFIESGDEALQGRGRDRQRVRISTAVALGQALQQHLPIRLEVQQPPPAAMCLDQPLVGRRRRTRRRGRSTARSPAPRLRVCGCRAGRPGARERLPGRFAVRRLGIAPRCSGAVAGNVCPVGAGPSGKEVAWAAGDGPRPAPPR